MRRCKKGVFCFILLGQVSMAMAQQNYRQAAGRFNTFYNHRQADSLFSMFSASIKTMIPLDKTVQMIDQLHTQFGDLQSVALLKEDRNDAQFKTVFAKTTLTMILALDSTAHLTTLRFVPYQPEQGTAGGGAAGVRSNFSFKTPDGTIYGSLLMPAMQPGSQGKNVPAQRIPVALIIAGSGPTDRNGNSPLGVHTDTYKMLADSLAAHGIASLRYDKRGIGESADIAKPESQTKFVDMITDAIGLLKTLKADDRFSKLIVIGHSEGSLIGMAAADGHADAYISLAGAGRRIDKDIERQLYTQSPSLAAKATLLFDSLSNGHTVQEPGPDLNDLFRASVQPYIISWLHYDPQREIAKLKIPVLIVQGTTDLQVSVEDAQLLKKAAPDAKLILIGGMNHVLKKAPSDRQGNIATYNSPDLPLKAELVQSIVAFISGH